MTSELAQALRTQEPDSQVREGDFLLNQDTSGPYGLIVANPPFVKLSEAGGAGPDAYQKACPGFGKQANLSSLFVATCVQQLAEGGVAGFILPESFGTSPTAAPARQALVPSCELLEVERGGNFSTEVTQRVVLLVARKRARAALPDPPYPHVAFRGGTPQLTWERVHAADAEQYPTIEGLGCRFTTGGLVWNEAKAFMARDPEPEAPVVLYSANIPKLPNSRLVAAPPLARANSQAKSQYLTPAATGRLRGQVPPPFIAMTRLAGNGLHSALVEADDPLVAGRPVYCENHVNTLTHESEDKLRQVAASLHDPRLTEYIQGFVGGQKVGMAKAELLSLPVFPAAV